MRVLFVATWLFLTVGASHAQLPVRMDTIDYYWYGYASFVGDSCTIDGKACSKEICDRVYESLENVNQYDIGNITREDICFARYRQPVGTIEHTQYEVDPDLAPFGEYINYYPSGKVKSKWYFQEPNELVDNPGIREGAWRYFNEDGDTIGCKRFQNGLAHGNWVTIINDSTWVYKEFKHGLSEGFWSVHRIINGREDYRRYAFHNGFYHSTYSCNENFETFLDNGEHVYLQDEIIEIEPVEYAEKRQYIKNGKFYLLRDGIKIGLKEFKNGDLVKNIKYDYR